MTRNLPDRLLPDRVTIRRPFQTFVSGTRRPVFEYQEIAAGVKARFDPGRSSLSRNVLGNVARKNFQLFMNSADLRENYEVVNEADGKVYVVTEVKDIFGHHLEAVLEEKKA